MDWTGEDHRGQVAAFAADRVRAFGVEPTGVDTDAVYEAAEGDTTLARGDFPIRQLDHLSGVLTRLGFTLTLRENGSDTYELLVARATAEGTPTGLEHRGCAVRTWDSRAAEVWAGVNCPHCSTWQMWLISEDVADGHCDCGARLFDASGAPLPHVTVRV
ncbi:hypothetical protein ACFW2T_24390 [Streptomyces sp. NPDC058892]|uniref:hypothetical protein n=1 Tax=unclassified Streptomyces TaxID=2593676 RepID=UPI003682B018